MTRPLTVKLTHGTGEDPERVMQAFTVAATAAAMGAAVSMWLTGDAVHLAQPGVAADVVLDHAPDLGELVGQILTDGELIVCTQCAARRGLETEDFLPGVVIAGSASFVEQVLRPEAQALVY